MDTGMSGESSVDDIAVAGEIMRNLERLQQGNNTSKHQRLWYLEMVAPHRRV